MWLTKINIVVLAKGHYREFALRKCARRTSKYALLVSIWEPEAVFGRTLESGPHFAFPCARLRTDISFTRKCMKMWSPGDPQSLSVVVAA